MAPRTAANGSRNTAPVAVPEIAASPRSSLAGRIMWLPKEAEIPQSFDTTLTPGCYNHPVVVLSDTQDSKGDVAVFMVTSFKCTSLVVARSTSLERAQYLPIYPSEPHPENKKLLHLANHRKLDKNSYVNTGARHDVPLSALRNYNEGRKPGGSVYALGRKSFRVLTEHCEAFPPLVHTGNLVVQPPVASSYLNELDHRDNRPSSPLDTLDTLITLDPLDIPGSFPQVANTASIVSRPHTLEVATPAAPLYQRQPSVQNPPHTRGYFTVGPPRQDGLPRYYQGEPRWGTRSRPSHSVLLRRAAVFVAYALCSLAFISIIWGICWAVGWGFMLLAAAFESVKSTITEWFYALGAAFQSMIGAVQGWIDALRRWIEGLGHIM